MSENALSEHALSEHAQPATMLDALDSIYANANRLIGEIGSDADRWSAKTPCTEWNVRDLVEHMVGTSTFLIAAATKSDPADGQSSDDADPNLAEAFAAAASASSAAWRSDGALVGMVSVPVEMPAIAALGVNIIDIGTHCWDLAEAIGADHGLSASTVATIDYWNRQVVTDEVRSGGGFGTVLEPSTDDQMTAMLAFVGREG